MSIKKQAEYKKRSQLSIIWNRLRKNKLAMLGLAILVVLFRNLNTIDVEELDQLKG